MRVSSSESGVATTRSSAPVLIPARTSQPSIAPGCAIARQGRQRCIDSTRAWIEMDHRRQPEWVAARAVRGQCNEHTWLSHLLMIDHEQRSAIAPPDKIVIERGQRPEIDRRATPHWDYLEACATTGIGAVRDLATIGRPRDTTDLLRRGAYRDAAVERPQDEVIAIGTTLNACQRRLGRCPRERASIDPGRGTRNRRPIHCYDLCTTCGMDDEQAIAARRPVNVNTLHQRLCGQTRARRVEIHLSADDDSSPPAAVTRPGERRDRSRDRRGIVTT